MSAARGKQLFGVADWRMPNGMNSLAKEAMGGTCLVDRREVRLVWFADTEKGIVKTFDVLGDRQVHLTRGFDFSAACFEGREIDAPIDGIVSETVHGKVELFAPEPANA